MVASRNYSFRNEFLHFVPADCMLLTSKLLSNNGDESFAGMALSLKGSTFGVSCCHGHVFHGTNCKKHLWPRSYHVNKPKLGFWPPSFRLLTTCALKSYSLLPQRQAYSSSTVLQFPNLIGSCNMTETGSLSSPQKSLPWQTLSEGEDGDSK